MTQPTTPHFASGIDAFLSDSDEDLAQQARAGRREAFGELARRYQVRLLRFLQRQVRGLSDAEDLLQETFVRAFERIDRYEQGRPFGTWLFTIAHHLAVSHHRRVQTGLKVTAKYSGRERGRSLVDPRDAVADEEARRHFWDFAGRVLSDEQMCATWLFYVEEMPAPQIAEVLGRSWVAVKTILFRARRKLAPLIEQSGEFGWAQAFFKQRNASYV